jgi:glucose-1-phosphate thymidylyltransferase
LEANRLVLDNLQEERNGTVENSDVTGRVSIGEGSKVIGSTIRGPAILGKNVVVENAYIGPHTAIADGCRIIGSELEYSILMERTSIIDIQTRIESSLIGHDAEVIRGSVKPKSHRLLIGDQSRIQLG